MSVSPIRIGLSASWAAAAPTSLPALRVHPFLSRHSDHLDRGKRSAGKRAARNSRQMNRSDRESGFLLEDLSLPASSRRASDTRDCTINTLLLFCATILTFGGLHLA